MDAQYLTPANVVIVQDTRACEKSCKEKNAEGILTGKNFKDFFF